MYFPFTKTAYSAMNLYLNNIGAKVIGVTSGCFDILHPLHVQYLEKCAAQCDFLIVGIDTDRLVDESKSKKAVFSEHDRAYMVSSLHEVGMVFIMDSVKDLSEVLLGLTCSKADHEVKLFKAQTEYYGKSVICPKGVELEYISDVFPFHSTTELVRFIQQDYQRL